MEETLEELADYKRSEGLLDERLDVCETATCE
jgi:hypothetical protein